MIPVRKHWPRNLGRMKVYWEHVVALLLVRLTFSLGVFVETDGHPVDGLFSNQSATLFDGAMFLRP